MDMSYTQMGQSGLIVSRLALGTMTFTLGAEFIPGIAKVGQEAATEMVSAALGAGVNFFDSADGYSSGEAETALGVALKGRRDAAVICTKAGFRQSERLTDAGLNRGHLIRSVEGSLKRLGTDYLDLFVVHKTDVFTPWQETLVALEDLIQSGKVRYIGCSNWPAWEVARAIQFQRDNGFSQFVAGQYLYNAMARDIEMDVLRLDAEMGVGLMAWSPLAGGLLTGKYDLDDLSDGDGRISEGGDFLQVPEARAKAVLAAVREVAEVRNLTLAQVALAWILAKDRSHTVLIGASSLSQLEKSLAVGAVALSADELAKIDAAGPPDRRYPEWFADMMRDEIHEKALS